MSNHEQSLLDPLRHNAWATRQLLDFCGGLDPHQLRATTIGTYGSILDTLQHILGAEGRYGSRLAGTSLGWSSDPEDTEDLTELTRMADDLAVLWDRIATEDIDPDRMVTWTSRDRGARNEARAGILVAQMLNHGNEHRAQIFTTLTTIGVQPPDLDGWSYGLATGRYRETPPERTG